MHKKRKGFIATLSAGLLVAAAAGANAAPQVSLTVSADAPRMAGLQNYIDSHKNVQITLTNNAKEIFGKIQLFNSVGSGWPDMYFESNPNRVSLMSSAKYGYAADLTNMFPASFWSSFGAANDFCKISGRYYCVKNDLAQSVLYYNKPLMDKFGYKVPTTMDDFLKIGLDLAKNHPGYNVGNIGDNAFYNYYLWPSGCQMATRKSSTRIVSNPNDSKCKRAVDLVQQLVTAGSLMKPGNFTADADSNNQKGVMLMNIGASWWGAFKLQPKNAFALPAGTVGVAPMPKWAGESVNWSGAWGGGVYMISKHSTRAQQKVAADMIVNMVSNPAVTNSAVTYPSYPTATAGWVKTQVDSKYYVNGEDLAKIFADAAQKIRTNVTPVGIDIDGLAATMGSAIATGTSVNDAFQAFMNSVKQAATAAGFNVTS